MRIGGRASDAYESRAAHLPARKAERQDEVEPGDACSLSRRQEWRRSIRSHAQDAVRGSEGGDKMIVVLGIVLVASLALAREVV